MISKEEWKKYIDFSFEAYEFHHNNGPEYYRHQGNVPFITHPLFAASILLSDRRLPKAERELGYKILILHDIIEDTDVPIPDWVPAEVIDGVKDMTYSPEESGDKEKLKARIYSQSPFIKLLTLCDTVHNMYEEHIGEAKRSAWKELVLYLTDEVEKHYGKTRVVDLARGVLANTEW